MDFIDFHLFGTPNEPPFRNGVGVDPTPKNQCSAIRWGYPLRKNRPRAQMYADRTEECVLGACGAQRDPLRPRRGAKMKKKFGRIKNKSRRKVENPGGTRAH